MITNRDAKRIFNAITAADGYPHEVTSDGRATIIQKHYNIPPKGRVILARNHAILLPIVTGLGTAHDDIIRKLADDDTADRLPDDKTVEFNNQWNQLLDADSEAELVLCDEAELLDPSKCDLPPTVISGLLPLIKS